MTDRPISGRPWLTLVAGPEASGKSTLTRAIAASGHELGAYVNADDVTAEILSDLGDNRPAAATLQRAVANEVAARRQYAIEGGETFTVETTLTAPSDLTFMKLATAHDFKVRLIFVATESASLNVARAKSRGGETLPAKQITSSFERALAQLAPASLLADETYLFDNSGAVLRLAASLARQPDAKPSFRFAPPLPVWVMTWAQAVTALVKAEV